MKKIDSPCRATTHTNRVDKMWNVADKDEMPSLYTSFIVVPPCDTTSPAAQTLQDTLSVPTGIASFLYKIVSS